MNNQDNPTNQPEAATPFIVGPNGQPGIIMLSPECGDFQGSMAARRPSIFISSNPFPGFLYDPASAAETYHHGAEVTCRDLLGNLLHTEPIAPGEGMDKAACRRIADAVRPHFENEPSETNQ